MFDARLTKNDSGKTNLITLGMYQTAVIYPTTSALQTPGTTSSPQLFLSSICVCVNSIFESTLEKEVVEIIDLHSYIRGKYEIDEETGRRRFTTICIDTKVTVPKGVSAEKLQRLYDTAHHNCCMGDYLSSSKVKLTMNLAVFYE